MRPVSPWLAKLAELFVIATGLAAGEVAYWVLFPAKFEVLDTNELVAGFLVSLGAFWASVRLSEATGPQDLQSFLFRQFCTGTGLSLVLHAMLNYFQLLTRSFFLIFAGGLFVSLLLAIVWPLLHRRNDGSPAGVLMIGFDPIAGQLARTFGVPIAGVIGSTDAPDGIPMLGELSQFDEIVAQRNPTHILVANPDWASSISPTALLKLRFRGVSVVHVPTVYEQQFERVYCRGLSPSQMLLSPSLCVDSRTMAIQAIYTNLIGLFFLVVLSPVFAVVAAAIALFSWGGPIIESVECSGFQKIPFRLLQFRTLRTDGTGTPSGIGRIIAKLHLAHLPLLINVVRGEIALIGPRPVRREFADRLAELLPYYSIRYFVKPGILGYFRARSGPASGAVGELMEIESDLFYVKQASPILDLEIVIRTLLGERPRELSPAKFSKIAL